MNRNDAPQHVPPPPPVTREMIQAGLSDLGLPQGAEVLLHSSLRSFGYVEGGADAVIDGLLDCIGPEGTLIVPTLTFRGFDTTRPVFDSRTLPSETGKITETVRQRPGALRSLHPLSSVAALGARAQEYTATHGPTPCGPQSPYWKLWERNGWIVFAGAHFGSNSCFHVAEEIVSPPYLSYDIEPDVQVINRHGQVTTGTFRRYACARLGIRRYLQKMEPIYRERGAIVQGTIGSSLIQVIRAKDSVDLAVEILQKDPDWICIPPS